MGQMLAAAILSTLITASLVIVIGRIVIDRTSPAPQVAPVSSQSRPDIVLVRLPD